MQAIAEVTSGPGGRTTVVIPVWDAYATDLLAEAVASLRAQDNRPEIIVVDNASEASLPDLEDVRVVRSPLRLSLGSARNLGLQRVGTPLVAFWDADDKMLPGTLAALEDQMGANPGLIAFGTAIVEEPTGRRHRWPRRWIRVLIRAPVVFAVADAMWSLFPATGATIMRVEAVREAGGYSDSDSGEDWCLGVSLAFRGPLGWSERPGRVYRLHPNSMWAQHMTVHHQFQHARTVRHRIREDPGIPAWARAALPLITLGQYAAIVLHGAVASIRRLRR